MNTNTETAIAVISAIFVLFTAMIDPQASFVVALVAIVIFVVYKLLPAKNPKKREIKKAAVSKTKKKVAKKTKR